MQGEVKSSAYSESNWLTTTERHVYGTEKKYIYIKTYQILRQKERAEKDKFLLEGEVIHLIL